MSALDEMPRQDDVAVPGSDHLLPSRTVLWILRGLCCVGLGVSGYLAWTAFNSSPVYGCSGEMFNCGHVLTSAWSKWFGIPVGAPAFGLYASLLTVLTFLGRRMPDHLRVVSWQLLTAGSVAAGLAALWFIGLQIFVIQHLCVYCLAAHACGLTLAIYVLWEKPLGQWRTAGLSMAGTFGVAVLVAGQVFGPAPQTFTVEHFDQVPSPGADAADNSGEVFVAAPQDVFEAPGDVFSAPGDEEVTAAEEVEVFEAPLDSVEDEDAAVKTVEQNSTEQPSDESAKEQASGGQPSADEAGNSPVSEVAATLLLILPNSLRQLEYLVYDETPSDKEAALDKEATSAESTAAETDQAAKADESTATADVVKITVPKPEPRIVGVSGNLFRLNVAQWPLLGNADAKYIFVEMFDYTCPHCRNTHGAIDGAFRKYGKDLAVVALVVPLHPSCNSAASGGNADACELARLSLAVWRVKPEAFQGYHDWMFSAGRNRNSHEARQHAEQLVGREALQKELSRKTVSEYISRHVELYKKVGSGSVPKLMFPKSTMTGEVGSASSLQAAIQREFTVTSVE